MLYNYIVFLERDYITDSQNVFNKPVFKYVSKTYRDR